MNQQLSNALFLLPNHLQKVILHCDFAQQTITEEIRLRIGKCMSLLVANKEISLNSETICGQDLQVMSNGVEPRG